MNIKKLGVGMVISNQNNEYLLHLRDEHTSMMTNQWSLIGGGVDKEEIPKDAAVRELFEETHLETTNIKEVGKIKVNDEWDAIIFWVKVDTTIHKPKLKEGKKLQFFTREELKTLLEELRYTNPFLDYLKEYISI